MKIVLHFENPKGKFYLIRDKDRFYHHPIGDDLIPERSIVDFKNDELIVVKPPYQYEDGFRGPLEFCSNFHSRNIHFTIPDKYRLSGFPTVQLTCKSAEHIFQACKAASMDDFLAVFTKDTPGQAKREGRRIKIREDWNDIRVPLMEEVQKAKYTDDELAMRLILTGTYPLIEKNNWGDNFWGAVWNESTTSWAGLNVLGNILMNIREEKHKRILSFMNV